MAGVREHPAVRLAGNCRGTRVHRESEGSGAGGRDALALSARLGQKGLITAGAPSHQTALERTGRFTTAATPCRLFTVRHTIYLSTCLDCHLTACHLTPCVGHGTGYPNTLAEQQADEEAVNEHVRASILKR